jgi:hypothetical protein
MPVPIQNWLMHSELVDAFRQATRILWVKHFFEMQNEKIVSRLTSLTSDKFFELQKKIIISQMTK